MVVDNHSFAFIENPRTRKYSNINGDERPVGRHSLAKYISLVAEKVREKLKAELPVHFGCLFDSWTVDGEHYTAIFASWSRGGGVIFRLLSIGVQDIPEQDDAADVGFTAADYGDVFYDVLARYNHAYESLQFLVGDNCSTNKLLADLISTAIGRALPFIGCKSHQLSLATATLYTGEDAPYAAVVRKLNALVSELRGSIKHRLKVLTVFKKAIVRANATRWNSQHACIERALEWIPLIGNCGLPYAVLQMIPAPHEIEDLKKLCAILTDCKDVSIFLQHKDPLKCSLSAATSLLHALAAQYPLFAHYLGPNAPIIHSPAFESGVIKLQQGKESNLLRAEKEALRIFKITAPTAVAVNAAAANDVMIDGVEKRKSFVDATLSSSSNKAQKVSDYESTDQVSVSSNICERVFSEGKLVLSSQRGSLDPSSFEDIMMLKLNRDLWDAYVVQEVYDEEAKNVAAEQARERAQHRIVEQRVEDEVIAAESDGEEEG